MDDEELLVGRDATRRNDRKMAVRAYGSMMPSREDVVQSKTVKYHRLKTPKAKTVRIFSHSSLTDYFLITAGTLACIVHGAGFPLLSIILGNMTIVFLRAENSYFAVHEGSSENLPNGDADEVQPISKEEFQEYISLYSFYYLYLGIAMFITSYIQIACWESVAERIVHKLRQNYLKAVLRQEISWFDEQQSGNLTARLTDDIERVREGIGDKLSLFIQMAATFAAGFAIGFWFNWQLTLVMVVFTPAITITGAWIGKMQANRTHVEQEKYAIAGAIAEETFSSMRTVHSLNGERHELERYEKALEDGRRTGLIKYMYMGIGVGMTFIIMHISYAVAFWFASRLVIWGLISDRSIIFTVFFAVLNGSQALGGAVPHFSTVSSATGAARHVLKVINNQPSIDPYSDEGEVLEDVSGSISFEGVHFSYPLRKEQKALDGITFNIEPGKKFALVGASGCGKSTIVNLLLRFYDPDQGNILIDGKDLRSLNVRSLRESIGIVSQEPILFDGTLEENIMLGAEWATREEVNRCCKMANAYGFIQKLSDGLYTRVGERGVQLSGGQKQRIAIARALIKNPKILILDEATSALDTESELLVQRALDKAQVGRTTILVAHRLSTIRDADQILVLKEGKIVESGTHEQLYNKRGIFYEMVVAQQINHLEEKNFIDTRDEIAAEDVTESNIFTDNESSPLISHSYDQFGPLKSPTSPKKASTLSSGGPYRRRVVSSTRSRSVSISSDVQHIHEMQKDLGESKIKPASMMKIFKMNRENWLYCFLGLVGCSISGLVMPFFALVYAQIFAVFSEPASLLETDALFWSAMFLVLGFVNAIGFFTSANMLGRCGEALTKKLRFEAFQNLIRQDISFFDDEKHNTGKLCTRFATDVPNVRYVFTRLPVVISSLVTLIGAIVIGFINGWKLSLILLAIIPLILASGYFEMQQSFGKKMRDTQLLEEAGKVASEAVENIRTVSGLNKQLVFYNKYVNYLEKPYGANMVHAHIYAAIFAFSQSLTFFMYALAFWIGSLFVLDGSMSPIAVFRVFFAIAFCGQSVGQISSFIPDVVKARLAASLLFHLIEYPTPIDSLSDFGLSTDIKGNIQIRNVHFAYPTRPAVSVLNGLNIEVKKGMTVALVGHSGCGKSTILSLIERFYPFAAGTITLDGISISDFNIHYLRNQLCIVSQEPILFDKTIRENIVYGIQDSDKVSYQQIVEASEQANIHSVILGLPDGYNTRVGEKGTQLSGGQKQRIAIARALIRNPSVLLLDEATSALDSENEKIVQRALENARKGRTCIVIAHRLSTVQNSDLIVVISEGRVVEQGTHEELYKHGGIYTNLCETQILRDQNGEKT